jgi:hypothetical protein
LRAWLALASLLAALPAAASEFPGLGSLGQSGFRGLAEDLGAALSYKGVTPNTSLGVLGFDVGIEATQTSVEHASAFRAAGAGSPSNLVVPRLHLHKGLVAGLDVGAFVGGASDVGATILGLDLRYAIVPDSLAGAGLSVRASATRATGMGDLGVETAALDLMVSKQFAVVTPYAGAGAVRVRASASGTPLAEERFTQGRYFGGVNLNLLAVNLAFEAEKSGDNRSLSAKIGWRF